MSPEPRSPPSLPTSEHSQVCALLRCPAATSGTASAPDPSHFHFFFRVRFHQPSSLNPLIQPHLTFPSLAPTFFQLLTQTFLILSATPVTSFSPLPAKEPLSCTPNFALVSLRSGRTILLASPVPAGSTGYARLCPHTLGPSPAAGPAGCLGTSSSPGPRPGWSPPSPRFTGCSFPPPLACTRPSACTSWCAH